MMTRSEFVMRVLCLDLQELVPIPFFFRKLVEPKLSVEPHIYTLSKINYIFASIATLSCLLHAVTALSGFSCLPPPLIFRLSSSLPNSSSWWLT